MYFPTFRSKMSASDSPFASSGSFRSFRFKSRTSSLVKVSAAGSQRDLVRVGTLGCECGVGWNGAWTKEVSLASRTESGFWEMDAAT
jgi:hypothetical protein